MHEARNTGEEDPRRDKETGDEGLEPGREDHGEGHHETESAAQPVHDDELAA